MEENANALTQAWLKPCSRPIPLRGSRRAPNRSVPQWNPTTVRPISASTSHSVAFGCLCMIVLDSVPFSQNLRAVEHSGVGSDSGRKTVRFRKESRNGNRKSGDSGHPTLPLHKLDAAAPCGARYRPMLRAQRRSLNGPRVVFFVQELLWYMGTRPQLIRK